MLYSATGSTDSHNCVPLASHDAALAAAYGQNRMVTERGSELRKSAERRGVALYRSARALPRARSVPMVHYVKLLKLKDL